MAKDKPTVRSGLEILIALLGAKGPRGEPFEPVAGITRLMKLVFLLEKEGGFSRVGEHFRFIPYSFGPYAPEVHKTLDLLDSMAALTTEYKRAQIPLESLDELPDNMDRNALSDFSARDMRVFRLNEKGRKLAAVVGSRLTPEEASAIEKVKRRYASMPLQQLLQHVYKAYPKMTSESMIVNQILGIGQHKDLSHEKF